MRSVYAKILVWCFGVLVLSLAAFIGISIFVSFLAPGKNLFVNTTALQFEEAVEAYQAGGPARLSIYLRKLDRIFHAEHHVIDASGKDLVTGKELAALLSQARRKSIVAHVTGGNHVIVKNSADGRYRFLIVLRLPIDLSSALPYYLLILAAIALLCWAIAANIASPLGSLARTVDRFGRGELSLRVNSRRCDEIGDLARSFDQMAERLQTLLTAERRLLQDISHELRSPLARLSFAAELTKTAEDRNAAAARLRKEIDRLTSLVGALLQMTRLEGDPSSSKMEAVALRPLLEELVDDCRVEAEARGCRILLQTDPTVKVQADRELLRRAAENVLRNAIRYAPEGTSIETTLKSRGGEALITVRDYGPGVPPELLPKIFTPFFRVDASRDNATGGVGLGLSIARRAVSLHHGQLRAQNVAPGLLVSIELPMVNT
jgi:signal transduction histidine kinase